MFLNKFRNIFASRDANFYEEMFPGAANGETFAFEKLFSRFRARNIIIIIIIIIIIVIIIIIIIKMFNRHILALKMNYNVLTRFGKLQETLLGLGLQNNYKL